MRQRSPINRYAPLIAIVAIQALLIALAPARTTDQAEQFGPVGGPGTEERRSGDADWDPQTGGPGPDLGGPATGRETAGGRADVSDPDQPGAPEEQPQVEAAAGDTEHCTDDGRQFDLIYHAPPCVPRWPEGRDNGGETYRGVTDEEITIVRYKETAQPAVRALLATQDLDADDDEVRAFEAAAEEFINDHYELYGREMRFVEFEGTCQIAPPDYACLRDEMRQLVAEMDPFFVVWNYFPRSPAFDELAAQQVLSVGGWHFDDRFHVDRRPFHWDVPMSGTQVAQHLAEYWCKRLAGGEARYAGDPLMQQEERRLGVITPDDPAQVRVLEEFTEMVEDCGSGVVATFSYAQDIDRANEQRNAGVDRMIENDVTTIICMCDGIAPYFLVLTCDEKNYHPEHIVPGTGLMDFDAVGRLYDNTTQWRRAFGVSILPGPQSYSDNDAARIWRETGRSGQPYNTAFHQWWYYNLVASLIQMAGPQLHPGTIEQAAFERLGVRGGWQESGGDPQQQMFAFGPGDYTWISDAREVYWCPTCTSELDGQRGAYVAMEDGRRFMHGEWPSHEPERPML